MDGDSRERMLDKGEEGEESVGQMEQKRTWEKKEELVHLERKLSFSNFICIKF